MHLKYYNEILQVFMDIVIYLRRLHKTDMFCGDLVNRTFIVLPANTVHY
jgi:hypothetical protein